MSLTSFSAWRFMSPYFSTFTLASLLALAICPPANTGCVAVTPPTMPFFIIDIPMPGAMSRLIIPLSAMKPAPDALTVGK